MEQGIGGAALSQGHEMLAVALAKTQQKQEGRMTMQLLQSATAPATQVAASPVGSLGYNIDVSV